MFTDDKNDFIKNWAIRGTIFSSLIAVAVAIYSISMILTTDKEDLLRNKYEYIVESLKVLGLFISGGAVIVNVYFAGRRADAMEETAKATNRNADAANKNAEAANRNAEAANKNAETANQKQITERFSKAIEQLGSDKPEVILGGIYTLERIARDSAPDQWTIMEVLTAFVRQNAPIIKENESQSPEDQEKFLKLRISIRACLTVIAERKYPDLENKYIDLARVNISGFNLVGFKLKGFNFTRANLTGADLTGADLTGADLTGADLTRASLYKADLTGADLTEANLFGADLTRANLTGADLTEANLRGADLPRAYLTGANLTGADLTGADLTGANLTGADLTGAYRLEQDWITKVLLTEADLEGAILTGATMPDGSIHD
ncbi:pentapeptide repeat-containing protein [Aphanizomenon flos-aquae FACHB-1416]|uniref:pentapeptide repeat-containing protein n=1 Tax=Aphanizomenon flos-aquae TaxID=1176 RepID=UPI001680E9AB|nr:pentapeptide repeat-containing protein [Aphanizomenon flos-aquae]MBD2391466.1 pentapeptide repeat-containing protein [Aphanizomenon flos-aquae FACHB-1171]MBD2557131.1 pentapeptide repeat-containing protein [Aphanizomenon flos-aquae FACHB-1290]MBD2658792.1 pentapeptide repeat-containing protein [Aphanizomenon flos-aquae FACHB-1265]MBD2674125.1 pentapeptide repeat-containing protein [Aphanizomenon flos-aquae FACHB-1416]MBD2697599.1 pentapeptide repeat-containing protein [Aphanizomenon flos-aq